MKVRQRGKRRKLALFATLAAAFGVFLSFGAGSASAAAQCSYDEGDDGVAWISLQGDTAVVTKGNGNRINVNGVQCGLATTSNTTYIFVDGDNNGSDTLVIDLSGGDFEPSAATPDNLDDEQVGIEGKNDLEFLLDWVEHVSVIGNSSDDKITLGQGDLVFADSLRTAGVQQNLVYKGFINLNDDEDADVWDDESAGTYCEHGDNAARIWDDVAGGTGSVSVEGALGDDEISALGSHGTGPAVGTDCEDEAGVLLSGGPGNDDIQGGDGNDILRGGPGDDVLDGSDSGETVFGSECEVEMDIATGQLELPGDLDGDWVDYSGAVGPMIVNLDPGELHPGVATGEGTDVLQNIENIIGSAAGDTLSGDNLNNNIVGLAGNDTIAGDAGNDCEWGNDGDDTFNENEGTSIAEGGTGTNNGSDLIVGGAGLDDTITYSARSTRVVVYLDPMPQEAEVENSDDCEWENDGERAGGGGANESQERDGADLNGDGDSWDATDEGDCVFLDVENAVGGSGNDILFAAYTNNRADNEFTGNGGNDLMISGAGNDTFHEGSAMNGADDMDGGTGSDTCDYSGRSNAVNVSLDGVDNDGEAGEGDNCGGLFVGDVPSRAAGGGDEGNPQSGQNVENINGGSGADQLVGNAAGNLINGNEGNDALTGGGSTDTLNGGGGDDWLSGGDGNDALNGGEGTDTGDYSGAGAGGVGVTVNLTSGAASGDGNDTLSGLENANGSSFADNMRGDAGPNLLNGKGGPDAIQGSGDADTINGGAADDEISGGAGDDKITGQNGNDTMRGNAGNDNLNGGNGADTAYGGKGNDTLAGGANRDWLGGQAGTDRCNPGAPGLGNGDVVVGCES